MDERPRLFRRVSSSSELERPRRVSSSSELERPCSSSDLNFVYLESDFEESMVALRDEVSGSAGVSSAGSDSETSAEAQLPVETRQRDRKTVQKKIESALHEWDARALQVKATPRLKKSDLIRSAVESWASPQAIKEADAQVALHRQQVRAQQQQKIESALRRWKHGEHDRALQHEAPAPQVAPAAAAEEVAAPLAAVAPATRRSNSMSNLTTLRPAPSASPPVRRNWRHRKRTLAPVDLVRCLADVRALHANNNRWKSTAFVAPKKMTINIGDGAAPQPHDVARTVALALNEKLFDPQQVFGGSTWTGCVLRTMSRSIVAPIEHALKDCGQGLLTYNKLSWNVNVARQAPGCITVTHERIEEAAPGHHEEEHFAFSWTLTFVLNSSTPFPGVVLHAEVPQEVQESPFPGVVLHSEVPPVVLEIARVDIQLLSVHYTGAEAHRDRIVNLIKDLFDRD